MKKQVILADSCGNQVSNWQEGTQKGVTFLKGDTFFVEPQAAEC